MSRNYLLFFLSIFIFFQTSCSLHSGSTYERGEMGQPQSFSKGVIISERNVTVKGTESGVGAISGALMGGLGGSTVSDNGPVSAIGAIGGAIIGGMVGAQAEELIMKNEASEFIIQPDAGEPFTLIQINDEKLKAGDRVLIINSDKIRITKDLTKKNKNLF
ncbi:MAG: hypothetical protein HOB32_03730 [Nitrospina sp.]|nr:hypothetical protein [Nitrospina sp.]MBT6600761.1 hypothetical protein [Nitrospina sp.]